MTPWRAHLEENQARHLDALKEILRIPSVSAQPQHHPDCLKAANWVLDRLRALGFQGRLERVDDSQPIVAAKLRVGQGKPTVTVYGHYDVQPPEPLDGWTTPPFEPTVTDGTIRARGATDDKGQVVANLNAVEALVQSDTLGVNLNVLIEGEEEVSGHGLPKFIQAHRNDWACDAVIVSDTHLWDTQHPTICHGLRGIATLEAKARGPSRDLHSGSYGGTVVNPVEALARAVATLKDDQRRVTVKGFYDRVRKPTDDERKLMSQVPLDEEDLRKETGAARLGGEEGHSTLERLWTRPTLEINGLSGGYFGAGFKTVLPSEAVVKISSRLVPDQRPEEVGAAILEHLRRHVPPEVQIEGRLLGSAPPWYVPPTHPVLLQAKACLEEAFGGTCLFVRDGASIPVVPHLSTLGPVVLMGYGMRDERLHAPDEFFRLDHFRKGSIACALLLDRIASSARS